MTTVWSCCVVAADGTVLVEVDADRVHSTASVGKVFLLCEIAALISDGSLDPLQPVDRDPAVAVADSGLWQHLAQERLPLVDACVLVAAVSDNWATNALLGVVSLDAVGARARALGCASSGLHDRVRDVREPGDPGRLSSGTAREIAEVARRIHAAASGHEVGGLSVSAGRLVESWLLSGVDLSLVGAPFRLDPLAHREGLLLLWSKTGSDRGVLADMGSAWRGDESVSYAAMATWSGEDAMDVPHQRMHALGSDIRARLLPGA